MKLYGLFALYEHENSCFLGIFSSRELAIQAREVYKNTCEHFIPDGYSITEIEVDNLI